MEFIRQTLDFQIPEECVVSLGKFDGLHLGHKYLLEELKKGKEKGYKCVIFTFDIPPKAFNKSDYKVLNTKEEKEAIFQAAGVDYVVECPFTEQFKHLSPEEFLQWIKARINMKQIVAGTDFHFGRNRSGSYRDLQQYAGKYQYEAIIVEKMQYKGEDISSTRVRDLIAEGNMEEANYLLGYEYFVTEKVTHGNALGREIGFPTANQQPSSNKLLPPNGVYASKVLVDGKEYLGISNIGCKPTIKGEYPVGVETFIYDFSDDIYGKEITVSLVKFIRPEQKFASVEDLSKQLKRDTAYGLEYLTQRDIRR